MVAIPTVAANAPNHDYNIEYFSHNNESDFYICPKGEKLKTTGTWHIARTYKFRRYTTKQCLDCKVKNQCSKAKYGKAIQRSEYQEYINRNKERIEQNKDYYRRRQAIVEHPYGTIKRQWGFSYIITKKYINRAQADVGLMFTAYNLRRIINIIGFNSLQEYLKQQILLFLTYIGIIRLHLSIFKPLKITNYINPVFIMDPLKRLIFSHLLIKYGGF